MVNESNRMGERVVAVLKSAATGEVKQVVESKPPSFEATRDVLAQRAERAKRNIERRTKIRDGNA